MNDTDKENVQPINSNVQQFLLQDVLVYFATHTSTIGWFVEFHCKSYIEVCKYEKKIVNGVKIYRALKVFENLTWEASYACKTAPSSQFPTAPSHIGCFNDLSKVINAIEHKKICCGVSNPGFDVLHTNTINAHGSLIGCKEECILVDSEGRKQISHSHRAVNCIFYMSAECLGSICAECAVLRRNLSVRLVRFKENSKVVNKPNDSNKSRTNKRFLNEKEIKERASDEKRRRINAEKREQYSRFKAVQEKQMRKMSQESNDDLLLMFHAVDKGIGENGDDLVFPENATMSLFWSMQREAVAKTEQKKSIRWHPLYVYLKVEYY